MSTKCNGRADFDDTALIKKYWKSLQVRRKNVYKKRDLSRIHPDITLRAFDDTNVSGGEICGGNTLGSLGGTPKSVPEAK